jgi:TetR/AcrR family transcriptional regulator, multidrug resistance operon repressor
LFQQVYFTFADRMNVRLVKMEIPEKKKAILESALVLITEKGFQGSPMSQVATKAGVAAGTIYHYFESKDELIGEIFKYVSEGRKEAIYVNVDSSKPFKERFFTSWRNLYDFYINNPKIIFFLEQYLNSPYFKNQCVEDKESFHQALEKFLVEGWKQKAFREMDAQLLQSLVHGSIITTAKMKILKKLNVTEDIIKQAITSIWDGIKAN